MILLLPLYTCFAALLTENIKVGDFSCKGPELENGLGSLITSDIKAVEALQAKLSTRVAKWDKELTDDEEHEEVFTLGRMGTRSQTRVSQYFTNIEIEEETDTIRVEKGRQIENRFDSNDADSEDDEGSETGFDPSDDDDNDFNQEIDGDLDMADENIV
jgi:hypothetical protein